MSETDKNKKVRFDLNKYTFRLLQNEPFMAALSRRIHKRPTKSIPTAGVMINKSTSQFEMLYNEEFMEGLADDHKLGVLMHEFYHIIFEHVTGRLPPEGMSMMWNVATDLSINSHLIGKLPKEACIPGAEGPFKEYPIGKSAEWYFSKLQNDEQFKKDPKDGDGQSGEGEGQSNGSGGSGGLGDHVFDNHDGWEEASEEVKQIAKERMKQAVADAAKEVQAKGSSWGTVSAQTRQQIMDMISPKVDWRKVLRYFVKTSQRSSKRSTVRRINKRFPYIHSGKKVTRQAKIAVAIDQSGSVDDKMLAAFFAELNSLAKYAEFHVIHFDTEVDEQNVYIWKKGQRKIWERTLCGGTCFQAPTDYVNKKNFDGVLILTDMMAPKPGPCKAQRMWLTDTHNANNPYFQTRERVIAIEP
jgi:predicted metal-dependent peptidase